MLHHIECQYHGAGILSKPNVEKFAEKRRDRPMPRKRNSSNLEKELEMMASKTERINK
jgi:hypothetical protein